MLHRPFNILTTFFEHKKRTHRNRFSHILHPSLFTFFFNKIKITPIVITKVKKIILKASSPILLASGSAIKIATIILNIATGMLTDILGRKSLKNEPNEY